MLKFPHNTFEWSLAYQQQARALQLVKADKFALINMQQARKNQKSYKHNREICAAQGLLTLCRKNENRGYK